MKYVKCKPPPGQPNPHTINNNFNNCNNTTNTTNNTTNNIFNIHIRADFDKITNEDIQKMVEQLKQTDYLQMVHNNIDIGKYVIPRTMEQIYFNDDFPNMQTLKKERRNDKMVEVHVGDGKWEKRLIDDIFKKVISRVEEYHTKYLTFMEEKYKHLETKSRWKQVMRPIKTFGNTMLWYEGFRGESIENIGIELNYPEDDAETEKERERRNKEMEQLVSEKVYEGTQLKEKAALSASIASTSKCIKN